MSLKKLNDNETYEDNDGMIMWKVVWTRSYGRRSFTTMTSRFPIDVLLVTVSENNF